MAVHGEHGYLSPEDEYKMHLEEIGDSPDAPKQEGSYSKGIIALMFITIIAFTVTCLVFYWHSKSIDPVLIAGIFLCFGFEFGSLAFIKSKKLKYSGGKFGDKQLGHVEVANEKEENDGKVSEP